MVLAPSVIIRFASASALLLVWLALAGQSAAQSNWQKEWEQTLAAAKKEGQINVYIYRYEGLLQDFKRDIPASTWCRSRVEVPNSQTASWPSGAQGNLSQTFIAAEPTACLTRCIRARRSIRSSRCCFCPKLPTSPSGMATSIATPILKANISSPSSAPRATRSWRTIPIWSIRKSSSPIADILHPKWKAKIVSLDPRDAGLGATMQFYYYSPEIGPEFMKKFFGGMEITYSKNFRQMTDWLAQGKFAICMGCKDSMRAKNQGLPVDDFDTNRWKEGSSFSAGGGSFGYMNQAPHPNAAKVFINWFLSRKGQMALQKLGDVDDPANSRRIDIPKDDIPPDNRLQPGVKYFDVVKPEYGDMKPIFDLAKEIMAANEAKK